MLHVFFGHEDRAAAGTHVFVQSLIEHSTQPVALTPITRLAVPDQREGTNAFTLRRFLVPWMLGFKGMAVFVDGADMLLRADVNEMLELADHRSAVQVVKHDYATAHPRKYLRTGMEADNTDYPRKNWASVMLINCSHFAWRQVRPDTVRAADPMHLLQLRFIPDDRIGDLPPEWNWLVDEHGENAAAKLLHWTAGIPAFPAHSRAPMASEWFETALASIDCTA